MKEEIVLEDGSIGYKYQDGSIRNEKGHFVVAPPYKHENFNTEIATKYNQERWEEYHNASKRGAIAGTPGSMTEYDAIEEITKRQTKLAQDTEKGHASTKAAEFVFRAAGWLKPREAGGGITQNFVQLPDSVVELIRQRSGGQ